MNDYKIWRYKKDGDAKFKSDVYNKMKPKWLFSEVASHDLITRFNILWFMPFECINEMVYMVNVQKLCTAGFNVFPFTDW